MSAGASDILTKNEKLILGLMWQLIQHFHVFQVSIFVSLQGYVVRFFVEDLFIQNSTFLIKFYP